MGLFGIGSKKKDAVPPPPAVLPSESTLALREARAERDVQQVVVTNMKSCIHKWVPGSHPAGVTKKEMKAKLEVEQAELDKLNAEVKKLEAVAPPEKKDKHLLKDAGKKGW